jgi:transposase
MAKPYSEDLRERVVRAVEGGRSRHEAAGQFHVSVSFVVKLMQRFQATGSVKPGNFGGHKEPKLARHEAVVREFVEQTPSATLLELQKKLSEQGVEVGKSSISRFLRRLRISYKKNALRGRAQASGRRRCARRMAGDAALWAVCDRQAADRLRAIRPLKNDNLRRRPAPRRPDRALRLRWSDQWRQVRGLHRTRTGRDAEPRRHRDHGQPQRSQARRRQNRDRSRRRRASLSPTLQPRSRPDRTGLRQVQNHLAQTRQADARRPLERLRHRNRRDPARRLPKLLHPRRVHMWMRLNGSRSKVSGRALEAQAAPVTPVRPAASGSRPRSAPSGSASSQAAGEGPRRRARSDRSRPPCSATAQDARRPPPWARSRAWL